MPPGSDGAAADRRAELGRVAGLLFLAGGAASLPADLLLTEAPRAVFGTLALAFASGAICLLLPWRRLSDRSLHAVAGVATAEVTLSCAAGGPYWNVFAWYFVLVAVFVGYVFRSRFAVAAHLAGVLTGLMLVAVLALESDPDALVRALVIGPTLCVGAGIIVWLREGLETSQARLTAMAAERRHESLTDALTGLANRRRLLVDLDAALQESDPPTPHTFALYDLDGFKAYNDARGHLAGDHLLALLAGRVAGALPPAARAYRLGGDEFCVLVPGTGADAEQAVAAAAAALASETGIGCSTGSTRLPLEATTTSAALSVADERMYAHKGAGRR